MQAIETFAVTVKEIAQALQGFGSELSESELPDEAIAIEFLLHSHTHRYGQMKVAPSLFPRNAFPLWHSLCVALGSCCFMILLFAMLSQDDIRNVLKEGRLLLSNLETVKATEREEEDERDMRADMDTVQRYRVLSAEESIVDFILGEGRLSQCDTNISILPGSLCRLSVCCRLLAQLRDMEEAFDGFFEKHHLKLQQYLQLLHYEISFQQVR